MIRSVVFLPTLWQVGIPANLLSLPIHVFLCPLTHLSFHSTAHRIAHHFTYLPSQLQTHSPAISPTPSSARSLTISLLYSIIHLSTHSPTALWEYSKRNKGSVCPFLSSPRAAPNATAKDAPERRINIYFATLSLALSISLSHHHSFPHRLPVFFIYVLLVFDAGRTKTLGKPRQRLWLLTFYNPPPPTQGVLFPSFFLSSFDSRGV